MKVKKRKMWLWFLLAGVVAIAVFVPVVGLLLPAEYRARGQVVVALSPEEVWERLLDYERYPMCPTMAKKVEPLPDVDGRAAWIEDIGSSRLHHVNVVEDAPRRLVREARDEVVPMSARWEIELEPLGDETRIWVSSTITIRRGTWHVPIFRLMISLTGGARRGTEGYLRSLVEDLPGVEWQPVSAQS